jgi:hypothetical protein
LAVAGILLRFLSFGIVIKSSDGTFGWDGVGFYFFYYNAADVMVTISSNGSQPHGMLETMACSIPVIINDIPSIHK